MGVGDFKEQYRIHIHQSVENIRAHEWNGLLRANDLPFLEWEWYAALECSKSISISNGWMATHIAVNRGNRIVAIAPLYVKMHSWGELVFDHGWQQVARDIGAEYFPKLVGMVPATPCSGYKFLISIQEDAQALTDIILRAISQLVERWKIKTVAFNFVDHHWIGRFADSGYYPWAHSGYSWRNEAFDDFDSYQQRFTKNQRRNIRRERDALARTGFTNEILHGSAVPPSYFRIMHRYYLSTNQKFGPFAAHFLNDAFFAQVAERYAHRILFSCCFHSSEIALPYHRRIPKAMAMIIHKNDALYGRYWGYDEGDSAHISEETKEKDGKVHFNVCYYTPIAWAIAHKYRYLDYGIGGDHKLRRGFRADTRYTVLRFIDQRMQDILARNYRHINESLRTQLDMINNERPIAHGDS